MSTSRDPASQGIQLSAMKIAYDQLVFERDIGSGEFSNVKSCTFNGQKVATKIFTAAMREKPAQKEIAILDFITKANAPYCVKLIGYVETPRSVVMENVARGSLGNYIFLNKQNPLDWSLRYRMMIELLTAIDWLQTNNILHRDIKTRNLLIDDEFHIRVADFGFATFFKPDKMKKNPKRIKGSPCWMAPEVMLHTKYSFQADIFSAGVTMWEIGAWTEDPFPNERNYNVFAQRVIYGARETIQPSWPKCIQTAIKLCWLENPDKRPTAAHLLNILKDGADDIPKSQPRP